MLFVFHRGANRQCGINQGNMIYMVIDRYYVMQMLGNSCLFVFFIVHTFNSFDYWCTACVYCSCELEWGWSCSARESIFEDNGPFGSSKSQSESFRICWSYFKIDVSNYVIRDIMYMWPSLPKPDIMTHFWKIIFCISEFYIPKALFYSNTNAVLQILFELG